MSAFLLGIGFRADMGTCARKLVLLKLIDACEDDGTRIFPAIATVARAAQCSARQVQREIKAFLDVGLLRLVREGGKGPRSTNEYALDLDLLQRLGRDGWAAVTGDDVAENKGDTVSPLDEAEKGDTGDAERVTPATDKGDIACHPTPPEPSLEPSLEREGAREPEEKSDDPARFERRVKKIAADHDWPGWASSSTDWAVRQFAALTDADRAGAERRAGDYMAAVGRKAVALGVYFRDRKWTDVPEREALQASAVEASPFSKRWMVARLSRLFAGPDARIAITLTSFERMLVADGKVDEQAVLLEKRARVGFPAVNAMHDKAQHGQGVSMPAALEPLVALMEQVWPASEAFEAWRREHARRGWPWLPDVQADKPVFFPAGGPVEGLRAFQLSLRGETENRQAAE